MIIVSQDKYNILNFDTTVNIGIEEITTLSDIVQISAQTNGDTIILGKYKTEERAKEVLQEIVETFTNKEFFHIRKSSLNNLDEFAEPKYILKPVSLPKVYEMPEE